MGNFDVVHNRLNTKSMKWDLRHVIFGTDEVLPMWVADMDFQAPPEVNEALMKRVEQGIYGYTVIDNEVKDSITNWVKTRHDWEINRNWLSFSKGVVTSLHMAIRAFTNKNDKVLIQTPVYTPFFKVIEAHDREIVTNSLVNNGDHYTIDFEDFEEKLKSGVTAFILCSPHNPVGRVWKKEELEEMARLCLKHNVLIISDEIHADLVFSGNKHIPIASLSDEIAANTITCMAPSKTFNLAGLEVSYCITTDIDKRNKLIREFENQGHGNGLNMMATTAIEAAYKHGTPWLEELLTVIEGNKDYVTEQLESQTKLKVTRSEGTYLLWIDCSALELDAKELKKFMIHEAKVGLNAGIDYGKEGETFMRMNLACPRKTIEEGVSRIIQAVNNK